MVAMSLEAAPKLRRVQSLDGDWKLWNTDPTPAGQEAAACGQAALDAIPATVPGDIHLDLMAAGRVADLFVGDNYKQALFAEEQDWWYERTFVPDTQLAGADRVELVFDGLDTFATVFLNGMAIGQSRNMWVPLRLDVTRLLRHGESNTLTVVLRSPRKSVEADMAAEHPEPINAFFSPPERVWCRKAQMSFGWDIAPRIVTCGIWRPVRLEGHFAGAIRDVWARTRLVEGGQAELALSVEADALAAGGEWSARFRAACGESVVEGQLPLVATCGRLAGLATVAVPSPRLWRTWDIGTPNLYDLTVELRADGNAVDEWQGRFGIKDIRLVLTEPDDGRNCFRFELNGRPTFMRGSNWIPVDALFARVTPERLEAVIDLAIDTGCNMLRVWGGGIYEHPAFYRLCDERGILVWHDFMYACGLYPQSEAFLSAARREAEWVVRSLRNHPCIALWAGDNECDCGYGWDGDVGRYVDNRLTRRVLSSVVAELDPDRPYLPSSPCNPSDKGDPNTADEGDVHIWSHSEHPRAPMYSQERSLFISEMGRICAANVESTKRFLPPESQWPHANPVWDQHLGTIPTSDFRRRDRMDEGIGAVFGFVPDTLEEYVEASQLMQAFCLSEWIQRARRRKWECGGILWWNLFDNWPQHADAIVDYYFEKKIAYAAVRDSSRLVMPTVALNEDGDGYEVWLLNDTDGAVEGVVALALGVDGSSRTLLQTPGRAEANASTLAVTVPVEVLGRVDANHLYLVATLDTGQGGVIATPHILNGCASREVLRAVFGAQSAGRTPDPARAYAPGT